MSPSDKIIAGTNSNSRKGQSQPSLKTCTTKSVTGLNSASTSDVTMSGTISSIPLITASLATLKCSINDQMKTFDPGEETVNERLTNNHNGGSGLASSKSNSSDTVSNCSSGSSGLMKNTNKNYKAGSKINKLADMLAKRSQSVVEVSANISATAVTNPTPQSRLGDVVTLKSRDISDGGLNLGKSLTETVVSSHKTANGNELELLRRNRRKSVPNQSCNFSQLQVQSTSKSCLDLSKLLSMREERVHGDNEYVGGEVALADEEKPKFNALGESTQKLQTDESTKRKALRKNLKNVELTLILPEKKRRFSSRNENHKVAEKTPAENIKHSEMNSVRSVSSTNLKKETKVRQRRSKRLVETSTQTADIEFITLIGPKADVKVMAAEREEAKDSPPSTECIRCSQILPLEKDTKNQPLRTGKANIKCQFCSRKLPSIDELKHHYVKRHPNKYVHCLKCVAEEKLDKVSDDGKKIGSDNGKLVYDDSGTSEKKTEQRDEKQSDRGSAVKGNAKKGDLRVDVSFDGNKKSSISPRTIQKTSPKEVKTEEQLIEMEMLFYSHLSGNIQENLTNHLDGKMGQNGCPVSTDEVTGSGEGAGCQYSKALSATSSTATTCGGVQETACPRAPSPYRTRSKTPNPLPPPTAKKFKKLPNWQQKFWEKYNFPTNYRYEHRFWDKNYLNTDKSALYLKDLSCLDIKTQLIMRENIKKLESEKMVEDDANKASTAMRFPDFLSLVPKMNVGSGKENQKSESTESSTAALVVQATTTSTTTVTSSAGSSRSRKSSRKELPIASATRTRREQVLENKRMADKVVNENEKKMMTKRQNSLDLLLKEDAEESARKRKGSLDLSEKRMTLRRQTSADSFQQNGEASSEKANRLMEIGLTSTKPENAPLSPPPAAEISGEWVKPRSYLCGTCCARFSNLWDLEDHKWVNHPNVWCTHYEFEDEKIEKLFQMAESGEGREPMSTTTTSSALSGVRLADLYKRYLLPHGSLKTAKLVPSTNFPEQCTKCKKSCMNLPEMHKHMLDCGGDTTWFLTMYSSPMTVKRKWRPFGSRRKNRLGRRDLKRNIPNAPNMRYQYQQHRIRTKPGDVESIQKMLANLPEKRARRAINFDEIKTRSQVTIHSNRMLRKRFKSSFSNNFLKMKTLTQRRDMKPGKKEGSSKSTTDTSSESTPVASPKRRNKLRESLQASSKDESGADVSNDSSNDGSTSAGKRNHKQKNGFHSSSTLSKSDEKKTGKQKKNQEGVKVEKPLPRSHSSTSRSPVDKTKRKVGLGQEDSSVQVLEAQEVHKSNLTIKNEEKDAIRSGKKGTKNMTEEDLCKGKSEQSPKKKKSINKSKGKKESEAVNEEESIKVGVLNTQSPTSLRLKQLSVKDKTDVANKTPKSVLNQSKKSLEMSEINHQNGSRRSLRLMSLLGGEESTGAMATDGSPFQLDFVKTELSAETQENDQNQKESKARKSMPEEIKLEESESLQRDLRGKKSEMMEEVKEQTFHVRKHSREVKEPKEIQESGSKGTSETSEKPRRSSRSFSIRKSISMEGKAEYNVEKTYPSPPILRKHSRTLFDDAEPDEGTPLKRSPRLNSSSEDGNKTDSMTQRSVQLPGTKRLKQFPQGKDKDDLKEMPILAKMEPLQGKINQKKEEEDIPILMPVTEVKTNETELNETVHFQIVKKIKTSMTTERASKEVTPLKIIKKVDHSLRKKDNEATIESLPKECSGRRESGTRKAKEKQSEVVDEIKVVPTEVRPCKSCNRYFLGICPCEIDKGREEVNDDSGGSDSEPLIMLINQFQKGQLAAAKHQKEKVESEEAKEMINEVLEVKPEVESSPPAPLLTPEKIDDSNDSLNKVSVETMPEITLALEDTQIRTEKKKKAFRKKAERTNKMTNETLSSPAKESGSQEVKSNDESQQKISVVSEASKLELPTGKEVLPERRSRRISKETKLTSEFVIDDPLILVDELWSDLDSDSDTSKKKSKKSKKKALKKKFGEERKGCEVNLEELLRNFGENKDSTVAQAKPETENVEKTVGKDTLDSVTSSPESVPVVVKLRPKTFRSVVEVRRVLENRIVPKSHRRLFLKLFRFNKKWKKNFGIQGQRLAEAKKISRGLKERLEETRKSTLLDLPFLAAEIKENPIQVIQCRSQKSKTMVKKSVKVEPKFRPGNIHLKISLPLESINNMAVFNNNHLMELDVEKEVMGGSQNSESCKIADVKQVVTAEPVTAVSQEEVPDLGEIKNKVKRSDVIDKIFYCEICQTYYYSSSQLKIHKLSNRHRLKEAEMLITNEEKQKKENDEPIGEQSDMKEKEIESEEKMKEKEVVVDESSAVAKVEEEAERLNDDTLEMPTLEGPFIEGPVNRLPPETIESVPSSQPTPSSVDSMKICQEGLKDIQRAIGCTDEEMLILTLLGENTLEMENDLVEFDTNNSVQSGKCDVGGGEHSDKSNGLFKVDLKQRMTSALTSLVNKAVMNLLQKYESVAKTSVNREAVSLLGKLSSLSRRQNIFQLNDLLKRSKDGEGSMTMVRKEIEKKEPVVSYKYQCTICGSRFEKASTRECHISRSHKGKAKKFPEEVQVSQTEDDWNDYWNYDAGDMPTNTSQFWCSDCGINFLSPQEVHEHQKLEHQAGIKEAERLSDASPLQSSTIGSSDEILDGKKPKRRSKIYSTEELDQQRIIANNELRKLDRKFSSKGKTGKIKWGMDALRFTVEKGKTDTEETNKEKKTEATVEGDNEEEKSTMDKESRKNQSEMNAILEPVPKLNFSRTSNLSEFKVIQKAPLKNRFQKIIDNKLKRKGTRQQQNEQEDEQKRREPEGQPLEVEERQIDRQETVGLDNEPDETETEVMLVPVVVKKKSKKQKVKPKKNSEEDKALDVYDFNESESEGEPIVLSHIKKPMTLSTKLKLVKVKESPSKNKADSTTKDLVPDDYDSEDSLPLSIVKKAKPGDEDEKISEDGLEKSDGILEQVEYLIEQLENETGTVEKSELNVTPKVAYQEDRLVNVSVKPQDEDEKSKKEESEVPRESLKISLASTLLSLPDLPSRNDSAYKEDSNKPETNENTIQAEDRIIAEPEISQSTFDEEDSMPLVLMSKRTEDSHSLNVEEPPKCDEATTDPSTTASEDVQLFVAKSSPNRLQLDATPSDSHTTLEENSQASFSLNPNKSFENVNVNGNVIYCRNESMSNFGSDDSNDGLIDSNYEKFTPDVDNGCVKEITEKEDVVIVCSKRDEPKVKPTKTNRKRTKPVHRRKKDTFKNIQKKRKRFPLLTATIEENNFRRTEDSKLNKEVIVRKIWNPKKHMEESTDGDEDSFGPLLGDMNEEEEASLNRHLQNEESQAGVDKEIIVNKIWSRKKVDHDSEVTEKPEDVKINKTEVSDEVVIKCGPKPMRRQRSKSSTVATMPAVANESSKETIMRKIWSGKCMFQTKAALKTYDSDVMPSRKENDPLVPGQGKPKKRGRPARFSTNSKKIRLEEADKDDEDDLDSLLEEIEREQLEKAIRLEFLQLRRSEKGNVEISKEKVNATVGLFTETSVRYKKDRSEKKRKKVRRNLSRHPRQSLLKRKKFIKKPIRRVLPPEGKTVASDKIQGNPDVGAEGRNLETFNIETKLKSRKHKKHRHKHHHHKHKHKKSKHRKSLADKHKSKHKSGEVEDGGDTGKPEVAREPPDPEIRQTFSIIDKICDDLPGHFDPTKPVEMPSPFTFEDSTKDCDDLVVEAARGTGTGTESTGANVYDFAEDTSDLSADAFKSRH